MVEILIDVANDDETATNRLSDEAQTAILSVSTITVMELVLLFWCFDIS